ncbi:MAG: HAD hydrolase-like protein [Bryobacteraceae bacterium]
MRGAIAGVVPAYPVYLFDVDGTLLDSAADICGAIAQVLEQNGAPPQPFEFLKSFVPQ